MSAQHSSPRPGDTAEVNPGQLVTCPHCGQQFPLSAVLAEELASHLLARREPALREQVARDMQARYAVERQQLEDTLHEQLEARRRDREQIRQLRDTEVQLRQERRKLTDDRDALTAEKERMRDEIRAQERKAADQNARERYESQLLQQDEAHATAVRELEDKLRRINTQLDEARRKGAAGSRQEAGFSRQDLFAEELRRRFPADEVTPTPRGAAGADVTQVVRVGGHDCGVILWECKRAAKWSGAWIGKLADDAIKLGADLGVIVSEELPASLDGPGLVDGIWVTGYPQAAALAAGLREAVTTAWQHKLASAGRDDTAAKVYDYIATGGFAVRYTVAERALDEQLEVLRREKRYYERAWAQREQQIETTRASLAGTVADLVRIGAELPAVALPDLPAADLLASPQSELPVAGR
jgi:hypothetical protein